MLCRREAASGSTASGGSSSRVLVSSSVVVGVCLAIGVAYAVLRPTDTPRPSASVPAAEPAAAEPGAQRPARPAPERPPPADRGAEAGSGPPPREPEGGSGPAPREPAVVEERVGSPRPTATERAPSADDLQAAMRAVRITVYSTTWCPHCTRARNWLRANGIAHTELDVEASAAARRERDRINPRGGVPTVDIDGEVLTGFGEANWSRAIARATQRRLEQRPR